MGNNTYAHFTNTDAPGNDLYIEHNRAEYDAAGRDIGLYIHGGSKFGTYKIDDIPAMIETLQAIYDDYEANKPKEPQQVNEITDSLPDGTVMHFNDESSKFVKVGGRWHYTYGGMYYDPTFSDGTWPVSVWTVNVDYNPNEEAN